LTPYKEPAVKVWNFAKSKMTAATILKEKYKNRDIPATA